MRDFVETNQALATTGGTFVTPTTHEVLDAINAARRTPPRSPGARAAPPTPVW
ncbi:hypothetical protein ABZ299_19280 [Streptomyces sp. NPDC006184]|uniref:hypothetical protein n=1 Tax=Streptomyces sp. NPDC006184 TaxID=3155455 RepID=UPI0033AC91DA